MSEIQWQNKRMSLRELKPWQRNPKTISKTHAKRLLSYWTKIGQFQTIACGPAGELYDGHQRYSVLLSAYGDAYEVDVRQSSRELTDKEREELVVAAHVGTVGQFNWDEIANWNVPELMEWGMDKELLMNWKSDIDALNTMVGSQEEIEFNEYDETIADGIQLCTCPTCGHEHATKKD